MLDIFVGRLIEDKDRTEKFAIGKFIIDDSGEMSEDLIVLVRMADSKILMDGLSYDAMALHLNEAAMRPVSLQTDDFVNEVAGQALH